MRTSLAQQLDDEMSEHAGALCELTEAQHALVLLADQLERHSVPFVPEAEAATLKARRDQETMRRLDAIGKRAIAEAFARRNPQRTTEDADQ